MKCKYCEKVFEENNSLVLDIFHHIDAHHYGSLSDDEKIMHDVRKKMISGEVAELSSGNQIRDFSNVSDVAEKIINVALGSQTGPINICTGIPITIRQLVEKIAGEYGKIELLKFGARPDNLTDPPCVVGISNLI